MQELIDKKLVSKVIILSEDPSSPFYGTGSFTRKGYRINKIKHQAIEEYLSE